MIKVDKKSISAARHIVSLLGDDHLIGLEENGLIESFNGSESAYKDGIVKKMLESRELWDEVWHIFSGGFWDYEGKEREEACWKKMDAARKALHKHHGTSG